MILIGKIDSELCRADIPQFKAGDTVKVHSRIVEGEKERIQIFEGVVLSLKRGRAEGTFTVRKISGGVGVERIFPLMSPKIEQIEVVSQGAVRQSRIYYIRNLKGKAARIKQKNKW
ncbi:MAG: 50S ribosomal protein L19 [Bacteroidia bacterium]|nr:50S ribosomal protein L19 [Bacteroidia bacterium]